MDNINHIQNEIDELEEQLFNVGPTGRREISPEAQHDELYKIILRERKDYAELEKVRKEQCEMFVKEKEKNVQLTENVIRLEKEKGDMREKIKELQKEIDYLRGQKEKRIQYRNDRFSSNFTRGKNVKYK